MLLIDIASKSFSHSVLNFILFIMFFLRNGNSLKADFELNLVEIRIIKTFFGYKVKLNYHCT